MLVKKINNDWSPSENRELKVGETVEITDPRELIVKGYAQAIGENGEEISAFDLYGVVVSSEFEQFSNYMALKKEEATKAALEKKLEEVKAKTPETPAKEEAKVESSVEGTEEAPLYVAKKDR